MEVNQLQAFITVAQNQSFSITATQFHLTQPAISKRISTLEQSLNTALFDRIGHNIQLTEAGNRLLPKAIKILQDIEDCKRSVQAVDEKVYGRLALASSHHIGLHRLPKILKNYATTYPQVALDFQFLESEQACEAVSKGKIELAIITLPLRTASNLNCTKLWNDELLFMVSEDHELAQVENRDNLTIEQISNYPMLTPDRRTYTTQIIERVLLEGNIHLNTLMTANDLESLRMLVEIGLGWSVLPATMLRETLVELSVIGLSGERLKLERELGYVIHKNRTLSKSAKAMIEQLKSSL